MLTLMMTDYGLLERCLLSGIHARARGEDVKCVEYLSGGPVRVMHNVQVDKA